MPTSTLYVDTQNQNENFLLEVTVGSTPSVRAYIYKSGIAITLTATQTAKLVYYVSRESSSGVEVDGTVTAGLSYIDFDFTVALTPSSGKYFASIILYDSSDSSSIVMSDGMLIIKKNPISN